MFDAPGRKTGEPMPVRPQSPIVPLSLELQAGSEMNIRGRHGTMETQKPW